MASPEELDPDLWQSLPDEVLDQVLPCLPLEAIFRFRAVCKRWSQLPFSPSFRVSCRHSTSQDPLLMAMWSAESLCLTPVLTSHGKKWQRLGLNFLQQALLLEHCDRITAIDSNGGLLCVCALNTISQSVVLVCNPLTKRCKLLPSINKPWTIVFRQVIVRVEKPCGHYQIFIFGQDLHSRTQPKFLYSSRSECFVPLSRDINSLPHTCGAFRQEIYYTLSRNHELIGFDTDWAEFNTGVKMTEQAAQGYKILVHEGRLFCAIAKEGNPNSRDDVVEFRIYELELATQQCIRVNMDLQCLFVIGSSCTSPDSRYDWDFVVHRNCLLLLARSRSDDPRNTRWLEVFVGARHRFPSLARALGSSREERHFTDKCLSRPLLVSSVRFDLNQEVEFA